MTTIPCILFVDDDPSICSMFTRLFQRRLPIVDLIVLNGAAEALALLDQNTADLLITDYNMPGMTGMTLVRELRARGAALPIVLLSGFPDLEQEALQVGVTRFLAKDIAATELIDMVATILQV
jgi:CheY-like chemotaxis protein